MTKIPEPISYELFVWKFFIGREPVAEDPAKPDERMWSACVACVIATDEAAARERLQEYAEYNSAMPGWLKVAKVTKIPLRDGAVLTWFA